MKDVYKYSVQLVHEDASSSVWNRPREIVWRGPRVTYQGGFKKGLVALQYAYPRYIKYPFVTQQTIQNGKVKKGFDIQLLKEKRFDNP